MTQGRTDIHKPETKIQKLWELNFDKLKIPSYQRPYKWTVNNVNQLIDDIKDFLKDFKEKKQVTYRLGTLVLHKVQEKEQDSNQVKEVLNIVDGQQRIITLALMIHQLLEKLESEQGPDFKYHDFYEKIKNFCRSTKFPNPISRDNILINASALGHRLNEFHEEPIDILLEHCEFVVISLTTLDEAFQFFDSQNSRGKELMPHDLLKAFHIREITGIRELVQRDKNNIEKWEKIRTADLHELFEYLYFLKTWLKGEKGEVFTKDRIQVFKSISLKKDLYPQNFSQIISHFFSTLPENKVLRRKFLRSLSKSMGSHKTEFLVALKKNKDFSFQIGQPCINGTRFFEMVLHYYALLRKIQEPTSFCDPDKKTDKISGAQIIKYLNNYSKCTRTGDKYVRWLFNSLLLLYIDKFGWDKIDEPVRKIFLWTYRIRLKNSRVFWDFTVQKEATEGILLKTLRDVIAPEHFVNCRCPIFEKENESNEQKSKRENQLKDRDKLSSINLNSLDLVAFYGLVRDGI